MPFIEVRFIDVVDVLMVAYIMYVIYKLVRGTVAVSIIMSIIGFIVMWLVVRLLKMSLLTAIMDSFVSVGLLALIIIFQPEVRRFLVMVTTRYDFMRRLGFERQISDTQEMVFVNAITKACENMSKTKTGALIVVQKRVGLKEYISTGAELNAEYNQQLIETIFFKNTPLHDGAMIVDTKQILAAACILPVSHSTDIPKSFGLRHRSALGITEVSDAIAIVVSEETGNITLFDTGAYVHIDSAMELGSILEKV
ncbi:MAG: diadenylate cyclase CdaA [Bacteroidales bacterium]|nr:diadenylate cyclase CdaA [Bacteroidales bacterium]